MRHEKYQYVWAATLYPQQRKINLLYEICDMVDGMDKITIMAVIVQREMHLYDTQTLSTYQATVRENIMDRKKRNNKALAKEQRNIRLQCDVELYRDAAVILREMMKMIGFLSSTDKRICKSILNCCIGMQITCKVLLDMDD